MLSHPVPAIPCAKWARSACSPFIEGGMVRKSAPRHLFDVIGQSFAIAQDRMSERWRKAADLVIEPDVAGFRLRRFQAWQEN